MPRPKGSPNKITAEIKERLSEVLKNAMSTIDIKKMTQTEKLKLIQIGLTYTIPKLKQVKDVSEDMPNEFRVEIIDRLTKNKEEDMPVV